MNVNSAQWLVLGGESQNVIARTVVIIVPLPYSPTNHSARPEAESRQIDSRCISYSSSRDNGSEAVASNSSGDFIHSWYFLKGVEVSTFSVYPKRVVSRAHARRCRPKISTGSC